MPSINRDKIINSWLKDNPTDMEIIGNIYENPELLKGDK